MPLKRADDVLERRLPIVAVAREPGGDLPGLARRSVSEAGPCADPELRQPCPGEQFAGIGFAHRRHVGMAEHAPGRYRVTLDDPASQIDERGDLIVRERNIAELVAGIDELDA